MVRTTIIMMILLLGISGGVAYMQWRDYEKVNRGNDATPLVHHIDIRDIGKQLEIKQEVKGLANPSYEIILPNGVKHVTCTIGNGKTCTINQRNGKSYIQVNGQDRIEFHYVISLPSSKTLWLEHWSVMILSKQPQHFDVQLVDFTKKNGMWLAGAPFEGRVKKESFILYSWSQTKLLSFPLYFQPMEVKKKVYGNVEVYARNEMSENEWKNMKVSELVDIPSLTIVFSPFKDKHVSPTFIVVPETESLPSIQAEYMRAYYASYFLQNGTMDKWVADLLTALALKQQAITPQAKAVLQQFNQQLTEDEKNAFVAYVLKHKGEPLTPKVLDTALTKSHLGATTYFTDLSNKGNSISLVFTKEGHIYVNSASLQGEKAVWQNGELLLPFTEVMGRLGYKVKRSGAAVFIEKEYNRWRFFVNSPIYMQGNDKFGTDSIIIHDINGKLYMSKNMMQEWFFVQVWETGRDVYISGTR
jgi:hypothetical protein